MDDHCIDSPEQNIVHLIFIQVSILVSALIDLRIAKLMLMFIHGKS